MINKYSKYELLIFVDRSKERGATSRLFVNNFLPRGTTPDHPSNPSALRSTFHVAQGGGTTNFKQTTDRHKVGYHSLLDVIIIDDVKQPSYLCSSLSA
jgi:hypothetical protein